MEAHKDKCPENPKSADALLDTAARMLHEELEGCHALVRELLISRQTDTAVRMMAATAALAGALAKLKGETRQRIMVERHEERQGEGRGRKSKNE